MLQKPLCKSHLMLHVLMTSWTQFEILKQSCLQFNLLYIILPLHMSIHFSSFFCIPFYYNPLLGELPHTVPPLNLLNSPPDNEQSLPIDHLQYCFTRHHLVSLFLSVAIFCPHFHTVIFPSLCQALAKLWRFSARARESGAM